jgi:hypothetical protein
MSLNSQIKQQAKGNQNLAAGYYKAGKAEHAAYAAKVARQNMGIKDDDQEYA